MDSVKYILDANVFIEAHRRYYSFDLCPGFWTSLVTLHKEERLLSIDHVKAELLSGEDELKDWAKDEAPESFFASTDADAVIDAYREIIEWVYAQDQFIENSKDNFARGADGWLVAYAQAENGLLVTHEEKSDTGSRKVKIPNVCERFNVGYMNTFEMLKALNVKFT